MRLFAALDGSGLIRYVDEVQRGAACGCFCPECGSALVAKQGNIKEWHFSHEAGQERPECVSGAMNLLRRVAVEQLQAVGIPSLPRYIRQQQARGGLRQFDASVTRSPAIVAGTLEWEVSGRRSLPAITGMLDTGVRFQASIEVEDLPPRLLPPPDRAMAYLVFWVPLPRHAVLQSRDQLQAHISSLGKWIWRHHPDMDGSEKLALAAAKANAAEQDALMQARISAIRDAHLLQAQAPSPAQHHHYDREGHREATPAVDPDWAPGRRPHSAFLVYRLRQGQGTWVIYTREDGQHRAVPRPAFDGWEEALPPSVGRPDAQCTAYLVTDLPRAMTFLAPQAEVVRTTADPTEVQRLVQE